MFKVCGWGVYVCCLIVTWIEVWLRCLFVSFVCCCLLLRLVIYLTLCLLGVTFGWFVLVWCWLFVRVLLFCTFVGWCLLCCFVSCNSVAIFSYAAFCFEWIWGIVMLLFVLLVL